MSDAAASQLMSAPLGKARLTGFALVAMGAALFSTKAIFIKLAYVENPDAPQLLAWRMIFALPFFLAVGLYALRQRRAAGISLPRWSIVWGAMLNGLIGYYIASLFDFIGLVYITAQLERLVLFTYPIFVMALGWMFFGGRITKEGLAGAALTYLGLAIVFETGVTSTGWPTVIGVSFVLGAALAFAVYQLLAKRFIAAMGSMLFTAVAMSSASAASIIHFFVVRGGAIHISLAYLGLAAGTAFFATVLPSFLMNAGLARIGPQSTAMISTLSPLVTIYLAVVFLGEVFTLADAIGTVLIIGGVGLYTWFDMRTKRTA
jgi:drug/metabolite transporter (DMT)-like permease